MIRRILEDDGHQVIEAEDGAEGVKRYRIYRRALAIIDMRLSGVGGAEVIRSIRETDSQARIIAVSGAATFYNVDFFKLAKEVGANAILRKLDPTDRVLVEVRRFLEAA